MKKNLIALAVASAFVAPVAMADTTIYGQANVSFEAVNNGTNSVNKISSNSSRLGFKGTEELGSGLSAIYQIESLIALDGDTSTLAGRNSFVGLSDAGLGTVIAGRNDTPYKTATRNLDVFADNIADNRNLMGNKYGAGAYAFDARQPNIVVYTSPNLGGVTLSGAYFSLNEAKPTNSGVSLAAMYSEGPLFASLAIENHTLDATAKKESAVKLGAGYTIDALTLNGVYEKTSDLGKHNAGYVAAKYNLGDGNTVKGAYARAMSGKQVSVGLDHSMSKRTTVYALYTKLDNNAGGTNGLSTNSTGGFSSVAAAGLDPKAISLGIKHSF